MKYTFDINNRAFKAIKNRTKRVEIRTTKLGDNHFDYSIIKNGDEIEFQSYDGEIKKTLVQNKFALKINLIIYFLFQSEMIIIVFSL